MQICKDCFYTAFEEEIHRTIVDNKLFKRGDRVAIAASGGKGESGFPVYRYLCFSIQLSFFVCWMSAASIAFQQLLT